MTAAAVFLVKHTSPLDAILELPSPAECMDRTENNVLDLDEVTDGQSPRPKFKMMAEHLLCRFGLLILSSSWANRFLNNKIPNWYTKAITNQFGTLRAVQSGSSQTGEDSKGKKQKEGGTEDSLKLDGGITSLEPSRVTPQTRRRTLAEGFLAFHRSRKFFDSNVSRGSETRIFLHGILAYLIWHQLSQFSSHATSLFVL